MNTTAPETEAVELPIVIGSKWTGWRCMACYRVHPDSDVPPKTCVCHRPGGWHRRKDGQLPTVIITR